MTAILLSGGIVGGLVPGGAEIGINLDSSEIVCSEHGKSEKRVIMPCRESDSQQQTDIFPSQTPESTSDSGGENGDEEAITTDSTPSPGSGTPEESTEPDTSTSAASEQEPTQISTGTSRGEETADPTENSQIESDIDTTDNPTTTVSKTSGFDFGIPLRFLITASLITILGFLAGCAIYARRRGYIDSPWKVSELGSIISRWLMTLIVQISVAIVNQFRIFYDRLIDLITGERPSASTTEHRGLRPVVPMLIDRLLSILMLIAGVIGWARSAQGDGSHSGTDSEASVQDSVEEIEAEIQSDFSIEMAWGWLAQRTGGGRTGGRTPEDIAREAQSQGYPADPVTTLLDAFRDVTYGEYDLSPERMNNAREAFDQLLNTERSIQTGTVGDKR